MASAVVYQSIVLKKDCSSLGSTNGFNVNVEEQELAKTLQKNSADLNSVSKYVQRNNEKLLFLENGCCLRICDLNGTVYRGQNYMLESWKNLYLPKKTNIVVLGALDNFPSMAPGMQMIVLVAEDGRIFLYEDEEMHKTADSLQEFFKDGIKFTGETYCYCSPPSSVTSVEDKEVQQEVLKLRKEAQQFVEKHANELLSLLDKL
ncbi:uncharacterized protein LOC108702694 [Xenopus laevis]|uniref:Uncharacterized protein LOC108702694 n=2 Tax=Xenopus laevis TaxID=8355 RepID=A0A1L8EM46_XENLA|nr:uncharacterized protein LOC108702694 [Xenopus laevis]XP_018093793.1 uncharacterized protein LOC108702694 [Xenopus laevis]XP_018093794.1 uncharacterized protein LOC108702694 [Xenopus laevis]OCT60391.1 hypothetical protein XELAEV_18046410mg [Xenopus laevis]